jgi:hypothetical protein
MTMADTIVKVNRFVSMNAAFGLDEIDRKEVMDAFATKLYTLVFQYDKADDDMEDKINDILAGYVTCDEAMNAFDACSLEVVDDGTLVMSLNYDGRTHGMAFTLLMEETKPVIKPVATYRRVCLGSQSSKTFQKVDTIGEDSESESEDEEDYVPRKLTTKLTTKYADDEAEEGESEDESEDSEDSEEDEASVVEIRFVLTTSLIKLRRRKNVDYPLDPVL